MPNYNNYPFNEIAKAVERLAGLGWDCFQKFSCAKCGQRLTMDEPNVLYKTGTCDKCGHVTNIENDGCNYLLVGRNKTVGEFLSLSSTVETKNA